MVLACCETTGRACSRRRSGGFVARNISVRPATIAERAALEALQWRASLVWDEYGGALLANPEAIELPDEQLTEGRTIVAELGDKVVGFAVVLPREDGDAELDFIPLAASPARRGSHKIRSGTHHAQTAFLMADKTFDGTYRAA
jgi:hypothetical protein